ncbi:MAG TPA: DUF370 domain-containing protein [Clostridiales bacterium]|nr:DUF370 domain-containing protein [Clostridiales bacterium]
MYLHLGQDTVVNVKNIIGFFDIENTTVTKNTKEFLNKSTKDGKVINVSQEMPRSFIVCLENNREIVYISQISVATLRKRSFTMF